MVWINLISDNIILVDSGTNRYIFWDKSAFTNLVYFLYLVETVDYSVCLEIKRAGSITLWVLNDNKDMMELTLNEVAYMPNV